MTKRMKAPRVTPEARIDTVREGLMFQVKLKNMGRTETYTVKAKCDQDNGIWYCVTHNWNMLNGFEKESHTSTGAHTLAWVCVHHGVEVP